jgi:methyl-accepting chemotaxis protein
MKWTVGAKIGAGYAAALCIMIALAVMSYADVNALARAWHWEAHAYQELAKIDEILADLTAIESAERGFILTGSEEFQASYRNGMSDLSTDMRDVRAHFADDPSQMARLDGIDKKSRELLDIFEENMRLRKEKGLKSASEAIDEGRGKRIMDSLKISMSELKNEELALLARREDEVKRSISHSRDSIFLGLASSLILLALLSLFITRGISPHLRKLSLAAERISSGDLLVDLPVLKTGDETGMLARSFGSMVGYIQKMAHAAERISRADLSDDVKPLSERDVLGNAFAHMVESLRTMTREINEGIVILASSASEISTSISQFASSSMQAGSAVNETATTVEEVKQTTDIARQKAQSVALGAQKMVTLSQAGKRSTDDTIAEMSGIKEQMEHIQQGIMMLNEHSQAIGEIITAVDDLAEQSNILAVNAAIEAAKAGDEGKGFSVVAHEIRRLAEQSKLSTAKVRAILNDIQKATGASVMAAEQGSKAVETGVRQSTVAGVSIQTLLQSIAESAQAATQIEISSQQQLVGVEQVSIAMESIRQASSQNLTGAKQLEAAASNLKDLGGNLRSLVERFRM